MIQLKIKVTKDILRRSMLCSTTGFKGTTNENCAVALAVRDIFPQTSVSKHWINSGVSPKLIALPTEASSFITKFDLRVFNPSKRLELPELEFTVEIPDEVIEHINIDEIKLLLVNHPTLELV